ncbi:MAG: recombinase family protein [Caulobacterales bacterium]|nr:recombinase family protein [Caulobacterales bacterium]
MKLPPPKTRVAIYARSATTSATAAIDAQIMSCRQYAQRHGWIEAGVYIDTARSGSTMSGRDGFFNMMAAADRGEFSLVLVEHLDRLNRGPFATLQVVEEFEALGVHVCTVASGLVDDIAAAASAIYARHQTLARSERARRSRTGRMRRKIPLAEAATVQRIFDMFTAGLDVAEICRRLNQEGAPGSPDKS